MIIFSKVLSQTDARRRCTVPMKDFRKTSFPRSAGEQKVNFRVEDERGRVWNFCCYTRPENHPKPVIIEDWIPFAKSENLQEGDRVTIYKTGSTHYKIKVEKQARPSKTRWSHVMNNSNKGSLSSHNSDDQSTTTFQPSGDIFPSVLNHDPGKTTTITSSSVDGEKTSASHSTSQDKACHNTEGPSLSLSLELTPKATMTTGTIAATSSSRTSTEKQQKLNPHSTSKGMAFYNTMPSLNLSLELTLKTTLTESQQHAYTQDTIPKTVNLLASFSQGLKAR